MSAWSDMDMLEVLFRHLTLRQSDSQIGLSLGATRNSIIGVVHRVRGASALAQSVPVTDSEMLTLLDCFLTQGRSAEALANSFAARGKPLSRLAVLWLVHGMLNDLALAGPTLAQQVDHWNPEVLPSWWRALPAAQGVSA